MKKLFLFLIVLFVLTGCATKYQSTGLTGGYSETQLGENIFQVSFRGNAYTSSEKAVDFTLLRSAELAMENGFNYFEIVESGSHNKMSSYTTPTRSYTTGSVYGTGNYAYGSATTTTRGGQTYLMSKPRANNTIVCYKDKPQTNNIVYEARFVANSIKTKYGIEE